jgi:uncharacterized protein YkwD
MRSRMALGATLACGVALAAPAPAVTDGSELRQRMLHTVNGVRAQHGLAAFHGSATLHRSARAYAGWMLRTDYFGHLSRIRASSRFSLLGEALAWHSGRRALVGRTVRRWLQSPPHRALILHRGFRWLGAGVARGRLAGWRATAWVLHFGGPLSGAGAGAGLAGQPPRILSAPAEIVATTSAAGASVASAAP